MALQRILNPSKTVVVLGVAYAGLNAVHTLMTTLPPDWTVVAVDRSDHFNHIYAFPRVCVLPGHEQKVYIPYTKLFVHPTGIPNLTTRNELLHAKLISLGPPTEDGLGWGSVRIEMAGTNEQRRIAFDYLVYALGSHLPASINVWSAIPELDGSKETMLIPGSKAKGVHWMQTAQKHIRDAKNVLVIGGGALGVQFASDIAYVWGTPTSDPLWKGAVAAGGDVSQPPAPRKVVTLLSSRKLLPRFKSWMHEQSLDRLQKLGVEVILGTRADPFSLRLLDDPTHSRAPGEDICIKTLDGRELHADLVLLCTGQTPNTSFLEDVSNDSIDPQSGLAIVNRHLQLAVRASKNGSAEENVQVEQTEPHSPANLSHIFVTGDAADAFGAINAGHTAYNQAHLAARNIARLVARDTVPGEGEAWDRWSASVAELGTELERYQPGEPAIKVSLGVDEAIVEENGKHRIVTGCEEDLGTPLLWKYWGVWDESGTA